MTILEFIQKQFEEKYLNKTILDYKSEPFIVGEIIVWSDDDGFEVRFSSSEKIEKEYCDVKRLISKYGITFSEYHNIPEILK